MALDIATSTGVAVGSSGGTPVAWSVDLRRGHAKASEDVRFSEILRLSQGLIVEHEPDLIAIEAFIGGPRASAYLIGLVACVRGCAANRGIRVEMVFPATVRKHFLGKALTSKDFPGMKQAKAKLAIKERVAAQCRAIGWHVSDLDAADALATWDWACATKARGYQAVPHGGLFA